MGHDDHGCCVCDDPTRDQPDRMDLSDDVSLRGRFPKINNMLYDGEVSYLIIDPFAYMPRIKFGFMLTGAVVMPTNSTMFRNTFLKTYEKFLYEKVPLSRFLELIRSNLFNEKGEYLKTFDSENNAPETVIFRKINEQYVYMPKDWVKQSIVILDYERRVFCRENNLSGAIHGDRDMTIDEMLK